MVPRRKGSSLLNPQDFLSLLAQRNPPGQFLQDVGATDLDGDLWESAQELSFVTLEACRGTNTRTGALSELEGKVKSADTGQMMRSLKKTHSTYIGHPWGTAWQRQLMCVCFEQQLCTGPSQALSHGCWQKSWPPVSSLDSSNCNTGASRQKGFAKHRQCWYLFSYFIISAEFCKLLGALLRQP